MSRENLKLGVIASALSNDPRVAPSLARRAGFRGLLYDARSASLDVTDLSVTGRREFRHVVSSQDQQLVGLRHDVGAKGFGPGADIDRELSRLGKVMETATGLGAPLVCVDLGPLPVPVSSEPVKPKVTQEMAGLILLPTSTETAKPQAAPVAATPPDPGFVSLVDAALVELGRMADRTSTVVVFRSELSPLSAVERILRAADCPWFGVDLDPAAVLADAWTLDETFDRLGPHIRHVRGRDAIGGSGGRTRPAPVGRGDTNWAHLLANLSDAGYAGWITLDPLELPDRPAAAAAGLSHLASLR